MLRELYIWVVLVPSLILILYLCYYFMRQIWLGRSFMKVASRLGLNYHPRSLFVYPALSGTHRGIKVHISVLRRGRRISVIIRMFHKEKESRREVEGIGIKRMMKEFESMRKTFIVE